jgi:predicted DNA-binding antitoxin AbrB/MazE fold protein
MITKVRARYANGVLTPLEPLDLEEGAEVELDIAVTNARDMDGAITEMKRVLEQIYQLPDNHPRKYKELLDAEDTLIYLEKERKFRERHG